MPYGWVAAAAAASGLLSADAAKSASKTQANAADRATDSQMGMFNTLNAQGQPYRQAGTSALEMLGGSMGLPGYAVGTPEAWDFKGTRFANQDDIRKSMEDDYRNQMAAQGGVLSANIRPSDPSRIPIAQNVRDEIERNVRLATPINAASGEGQAGANATGSLMHQFNADDLQSNLAPNYDFMKQQGLGATQNMLNAKGGNISGNTMRGMTQFAEDYAGTGYQNAFQNYTANQTNIFNRLAAIAGIGQTANQASANAGTSLAQGAANSMMNAGASRAGGTVGAANAISGGMNNAASWYSMPSMMNQGSNNSYDPNFATDAGNSMAASG